MKINPRLIEAAGPGCSGRLVLAKVASCSLFRALYPSYNGICSGGQHILHLKKLGGTGTAMIGDIIESQFKVLQFKRGAAMSFGLMVIIFLCMWVMNKFTDSEEVDLI